MRNFLSILLVLTTSASYAELKSMDMDDMDSILSETGKFTSTQIQHHTNIRANFDVGSSNGSLSNCSNRKPRKEYSFYPCWNNQAKSFYSKLSFALKKQSTKKVNTTFTFNILKNGGINNLRIKGIKDVASKKQLKSLLMDMEFGFSNSQQPRQVAIYISSSKP